MTPAKPEPADPMTLAQRVIDNPGWAATWADNVVRPIAEALLRSKQTAGTRTAGTHESCDFCGTPVEGRETCLIEIMGQNHPAACPIRRPTEGGEHGHE